MNGVYLRALPLEEYADVLLAYLREQGYDWDETRVRLAAPLVQEKIARLGDFPAFAGFLFGPVDVDRAALDGADGRILSEATERLRRLEPFDAERIEGELRALAEDLDMKPRQAFAPIRVAVTGSTVSPGLFESIALLGRDETLARLAAASG